jgi:DNA polymerase III delta prime subunit
MNLAIDETTRQRIQTLSDDLPQSLLLSGQTGVGLRAIAQYSASRHAIREVIVPELLTKTSTKPQIGIERIRQLYEDSRSKSKQALVVIIDEADLMTIPAQNSFLKLLEEPSSSIRFVLTSHYPDRLLPTVRSRIQTIHIPKISSEATMKFLQSFQKIDDTRLRQLLFLADGLPAEITRLMNDEVYFRSSISSMSFARKIIEANSYEKLAIVLSTKMDRISVLNSIEKMISLMSRNPSRSSLEQIERLFVAQERVDAYANPRLQLVSAVV